MCGKTEEDMIRNEHFRENLGVESIGDKSKETCLTWFECVQCRPAMVH